MFYGVGSGWADMVGVEGEVEFWTELAGGILSNLSSFLMAFEPVLINSCSVALSGQPALSLKAQPLKRS